MAGVEGDRRPPEPALVTALGRTDLRWFAQVGVGYYPVTAGHAPYDADYFAKYAAYAQTDLGLKLNLARIDLVAQHWDDSLVDVGIGSGSFVEARPMTWGYDVNPAGIEWLTARGKFLNPYFSPCAAVSFWDVLEHIADFPALLANVSHRVFVSVPIFTGPSHALASRHFRPDEHCWYFTHRGLISVMRHLGWQCLESNDEESRLGRDQIGSFAFGRRA